MNWTQKQLLHEFPEQQAGSQNRCLLDMVRKFNKGAICKPYFQRDYVWEPSKLRGFAKTIINKQAIGVIVTYQLKGGGPVFLADGFQRLNAAARFCENPQEYGFPFDSEQAETYCEVFGIDVQHRIYNDHNEAMGAFFALNNGTSLTPEEYYKGLLTGSQKGTLIANKVPDIVSAYERPYLTGSGGKSRADKSKYIRDSYALFLQYITKTSQMAFRGASSNRVDGENIESSVEYQLAEHIRGMSQAGLEKLIHDFDKHISTQVAFIATLIEESGQKGKGMSGTFCRWCLHLATWRKNTGRPVPLYEKLMREVLSILKPYQSFTTRFSLPNTSPMVVVSLRTSDLNGLLDLCRSLEIPLYDPPKRKKGLSAPGHHISHQVPFSHNGEGETFIESGLRNMSRGARPTSEDNNRFDEIETSGNLEG